MSQFLDKLLQAHKRSEAVGIASICSAHPWVLKIALQGEDPVLIESTCNQVNQFGGYTGLTPDDFVRFVRGIADENHFPLERLILGGDHLGPWPWKKEPVEIAIQKAEEIVRSYVTAGYTKIHLDASMRLAGDNPATPVDLEIASQRTVRLVKASEAVADLKSPPRYVIGTEVPLPGGVTSQEGRTIVTRVEDARRMLEVTKAEFLKAGLDSAWERVIAVVVQPGIEFGDDFILDYDQHCTHELARFCKSTRFVFEAHSTDYQTRTNLRKLVEDHFAILKVGPALTHAFREAVFALAMMERELFPIEKRSKMIETLESAMIRKPFYWMDHYHGSERELILARKYSLSDRARYYWADPSVQEAFNILLFNMNSIKLPVSLISQFLPDVYSAIRSGEIQNSTRAIITYKIESLLGDYSIACSQFNIDGNK